MRSYARSSAAGVTAAAATLLLHSLFVAMAMWEQWGIQHFPDRPDAIGAGANRGTPEGDSSERRMIVRLLSEVDTRPSPPTRDAYLAEQLEAALKVEITGQDSLPIPPLIVGEAEPAESSDAELIARSKMVGIYESQVRARIERAWKLPEESKQEPGFTCRPLIRQHRDGRVMEVELPYDGCAGTPALRQSLVHAIFSASPLPAPPHPEVFVDSFSLIFRSESVR